MKVTWEAIEGGHKGLIKKDCYVFLYDNGYWYLVWDDDTVKSGKMNRSTGVLVRKKRIESQVNAYVKTLVLQLQGRIADLLGEVQGLSLKVEILEGKL